MNYGFRYGITQFVFGMTLNIVSVILLYTYFDYLWLILAFLIFKINNLIGVGYGLHMYYSHNTRNKFINKHLYLVFGFLSGIGRPLQFVRYHILHHKYSDTDKDLSSLKVNSVLELVSGWWVTKTIYYHNFDGYNLHLRLKYLLNNRLFMFVNNNYYLLHLSLILAVSLVSIKVALYFLILPIVFNILDANIIFTYLLHKTGKPVANNCISLWYLVKNSGKHNIHHKIFKE